MFKNSGILLAILLTFVTFNNVQSADAGLTIWADQDRGEQMESCVFYVEMLQDNTGIKQIAFQDPGSRDDLYFNADSLFSHHTPTMRAVIEQINMCNQDTVFPDRDTVPNFFWPLTDHPTSEFVYWDRTSVSGDITTQSVLDFLDSGTNSGLIQSPPLDTDNDGIQNIIDQCVADPEIFNNFEDEDGCPDYVNLIQTITSFLTVLDPRVPETPAPSTPSTSTSSKGGGGRTGVGPSSGGGSVSFSGTGVRSDTVQDIHHQYLNRFLGHEGEKLDTQVFLAVFGVYGQTMPEWNKNTIQWVLDGKITLNDFQDSLKWQYDNNLIK